MYSLDEKNKILDGLVGDVKIYRLRVNDVSGEEYEYMALHNGNKTQHGIKDMTIDQLIKVAWELKSPSWVKITSICANLIGSTVWFNKQHELVVASVAMGKDGVDITMKDGSVYTDFNLWIKE